MPKRIILDTNVILMGSLLSNSYAGQLWRRQKDCSFIVPNYVISESRRVVQANAMGQDKIIAASILIDIYLKRLNVLVLNELTVEEDVDKAISSSAVTHECEFICTYNIKHFQIVKTKVLSPLSLIKELFGDNLHDDFLPFFYFGEEGTVLFHGILTHQSSLGEILKTNNGIEVYVDGKGIFQVKGPAVKSIRNQVPLPAVLNQHLFLILRYNKQFFEARRWIYEYQKWEVLCEGNAEFQVPISPALGTAGHLNAIIYDFSAIPRFVKNKQLSAIVQNGCLENAIGSEDIKALLIRLRIEKVASDEWKVTF